METVSRERAEKVRVVLAELISELNDLTGPWILVHPARWCNRRTGAHVETGYSYGEARVRVYSTGGRTADRQYVISGRDDDLAGLRDLFPVPVA